MSQRSTIRRRSFESESIYSAPSSVVRESPIPIDPVWRQCLAAGIATLTMVVVGAINGWAKTSLHQLMSNTSDVPLTLTHDESSWIVSLTVPGSIIGSLVGALLADRCGRKFCLLLCSTIFTLGWFIIYVATTVSSLYFARVIHGIGVGIAYTINPMFVSEIADIHIRGVLGSLISVNVYAGSMLTCVLGLWLTYESLLLVLAIGSFICILLNTYYPETPYFLVTKGKMKQADKSIAYYKGIVDPQIVDIELRTLRTQARYDFYPQSSYALQEESSSDVQSEFVFTVHSESIREEHPQSTGEVRLQHSRDTLELPLQPSRELHSQSTSEIHRPSTSEIHRPSTSEIYRPSTSAIHLEPTSEMYRQSTSQVQPEPRSEIQAPSTSQIHRPSTSAIHPEPTSEMHRQSTSQVQPEPRSEIQAPSTSQIHRPSTSAIHPEPTSEMHRQSTSQAQPAPTSEIQEPSTSQIHRPSTSQTYRPSLSEVHRPPTSQIYRPPSHETFRSSTGQIDERSIRELLQSATNEIYRPSTSQIRRSPTSQIHRPSTSAIHLEPTSEMHRQSTSQAQPEPTSEIQAPSTSQIHRPSTSQTHRPSTSEIQPEPRSETHSEATSEIHTSNLITQSCLTKLKLILQRSNRKALFIMLGLIMAQHLSGNFITVQDLQLVLREAKVVKDLYGGMIAIQLIKFLSNGLTMIMVDLVGRRKLLILSTFGSTLTLTIRATYLLLGMFKIDVSIVSLLPVIDLIIYQVLFQIGLGTLPYVLLCELFPTKLTGFVAAIIVIFDYIIGFSVSKLHLEILDKIGLCGTSYIFAIACSTTFLMVRLWVPETKGRTYQQIEALLDGNNLNSSSEEVRSDDEMDTHSI
ncbi:facilitated trehalose transporter Tret1-like isoform X11 [Bombus affinis]|uniref:facilitated trehalose transporter Tret1-like isoform X11 n=2 Tax=Bombus affinis TaxID=309941 RepID=UPI0021B7763C|nr:facilitated trehalose transporter Tret1-like isoform X11 [Bombus affinis]